MSTRVRTLDFLPEIFRTRPNEQFLSATLDQLTQQPVTTRVQGYIGSKFGYGISASDKYLVEPSKVRADYQLEPSVVFKKKDTEVAADVLTYPGLLDSLSLQNGIVNDNSRLFENQFYSWDSFVDLDKIINYGQYYWLPFGPDAVSIFKQTEFKNLAYTVTDTGQGYNFAAEDVIDATNPVITLIRGGRYEFNVNQESQFFIQTEPGTSGTTKVRPNISSREVFGVDNNGASIGKVVFNVPLVSGQDTSIYPGNFPIDLVSTLKINQVHGSLLSQIGSIDGVNDLQGKTVIFYGNEPGTIGRLNEFYNGEYDEESFENTVFTDVNKHYYTINLISTGGDYIIQLSETGLLPNDTSLPIQYGVQYSGRIFVKSSLDEINLTPIITATLDTLYYQDGLRANKVGIIKLIDNPNADVFNVADILGRKTYTSPNGVTFTNGLKIQFLGNVFPESYATGQYYVEGVGTSIGLLPVTQFEVPELFAESLPQPYDSTVYDASAYNDNLFAPLLQDYITIARNSINRNGWSRSNRWFHIDVLKTTIAANPSSVTASEALGNSANRAKRPIIEFYPNLKLFNSGVVSKQNISYINFSASDAFNQVAGQTSFSPDGGSSELFDGATIVFAGDENVEVRNKIFVARFITPKSGGQPVISLQVSADGDVAAGDQSIVLYGLGTQGKTYYFDGTNWNLAQLKERQNQPPKFDVLDENNISFSDTDFYPSSTFAGSTLFQYAVGTGADDPILRFPISYSSTNNIGDIKFENTFASDTFKYLANNLTTTKDVKDGYVNNYSSRTVYTRALGWQTTVGESFQYQVFSKTYTGIPPEPSFVCDVKVKDSTETQWPTIVVYVNNERISSASYTVTTTDITTTLTLSATPPIGTKVEILLYSDQVSSEAYYQVPSNLDRNPFNSDITFINLGDIRGHYKSICNNVPGFVGPAFGPNNYRDLGNVIPYGTKIIQNSASVASAGAFLRTNDKNFFDALSYNANEYTKFKSFLINTLDNGQYTPLQTPETILDDVLDQLASARIDSNPFFWSDMVPSKNANLTNRYTFRTRTVNAIVQLAKVYDFNSANYFGVLVYTNQIVNGLVKSVQLVKDVDYVVSETEPSLTVTKELLPNTVLIVKEYDQTYGSFVPNTPTKLGLYPAFVPSVVLDNTYVTPTYFIKGHDGSYNKLYGNYVNGQLDDFRDQVLLEFELRVYNNLKVSNQLPISYDEIVPGAYREVGYTRAEYLNAYSVQFLNWVGNNRINYTTHFFDQNNTFTYNYTGSIYKDTLSPVTQGNWRGIFMWLYDTSNPDTAPWEILGLANKPSWWDSRYGSAPYTSDNLFMWEDIKNGYVWNDGNPYVNEQRIRPTLLDMLPVDSLGNLVSPADFAFGYVDSSLYSADWKLGEMGPTEFSYQRSSTWPFDLVRLMALLKPAKFFALGINVDRYRYNSEFNQYLYDNRSRDYLTDIQVYGSGTPVHSYTNWLVDYLYQFGINGTDSTKSLLENLDVRLSYRVAGFTDKDLMRFYVEKGSPSSSNNSLMVPDESYSILLYDNQPMDTLIYSSVIVQRTEVGYRVLGNSQDRTFFRSFAPSINGVYENITISGRTLTIPKNYSSKEIIYPYGHEFTSIQDLSIFLKGYGLFLNSQGMIFDDIENGLELNWNQMIAETFYWSLTGWDVGSTINVNPSARILKINKENTIVQPLTFRNENFVLNQNLLPIALSDLYIDRNGTQFTVKTLNQGDTVSLFKANLSTIEHVVVFDNKTVFNDVLYNLITGLRQQRMLVKGTKSAEWNGTINAAGFLLNQDNIKEWQENVKYVKGTIVRFKNEYYVATKLVVLPKTTFDYAEWEKTGYDQIQKGLLPNPSTRALEATLYYDSTNPNLANDADLLSFSLIGYRPRDYMVQADLDDATQVNLYKNMIPAKGTVDNVTRLQGVNLQQNSLNYEVYENWAIKNSEFGGLLNQNFVEFKLAESELTGNPSIVGLVTDNVPDDVQQVVPLYNVTNYGRPIYDEDILKTVDTTSDEKLPSAGYANLDDMQSIGYDIAALPDETISEVYKDDYLYVADKDSTWNVFTPLSTGALVVAATNNLNGTVTLTFDKPHGLVKNETIGVVNFDPRVDGYHEVTAITNLTSVVVLLSLTGSSTSITGSGIAYKLQSQRVSTARDIALLPLLNTEYTNNKVWVDRNQAGDWTVYEKTNNYDFDEIQKIGVSTTNFGAAVLNIPNFGYLVGDPANGTVYHYDKNDVGFYLRSTIVNGGAFGTAMTISDDLIIISSPGNILSQIYIYRIPANGAINSLVLQQVIAFGGKIGDSVAVSKDSNLLYLGAPTSNVVIPFQRDRVLSYTSTGLRLNSATTVGNKTFTIAGNATSLLFEGERVTFLTSFTSTGMTLSANIAPSTNYFVVNGDQRSVLTYGDQVTFNNTGPVSSRVYTVGSKAYDSGTNKTTFFIIEFFETGIAVNAGATVYTVAFNENETYTVVTSLYTPSTNVTTFFTLEEIAYSTISGSYVYIATDNFSIGGVLSSALVSPGDRFGFSLATNNDGSKLFVGAPYTDFNPSLPDTGVVYVWDRLIQNVEVQYDQNPYDAYVIILPFVPTNQTRVYLNDVLLDSNKYVVVLNGILIGNIGLRAGDIVTVNSLRFTNTTRLYNQDNTSDLRSGELFGYSLACNKFGSELIVGCPFDVSNDSTKEGSVVRFTNEGKRFGKLTGVIGCNLADPTYILLNGQIVNAFNDTPLLSTVTSGSTTCTIDATIAAGLPAAGVITLTQSGVSRSIAYSARNVNTGVLTFAATYTDAPTFNPVTTNVTVPLGNAANVANAINRANITNIRAFATQDNRLQIRLLFDELGQINNKLNISVFNGNDLFQMGLIDYAKTQVIQDPHAQTSTRFGYSVAFNEENSFVAGAPSATRYVETLFDYIDDNDTHNDTVFDNNLTVFEDQSNNAGAVYMFDYINSYEESLTDIGNYVYAQSCNDTVADYGLQPMYGASVAFSNGEVVVGSPNYLTSTAGGRAVVYSNSTNEPNWHVYRQSNPVVDINKIQKVQLYNNINNENIASLDYIDPVQGKLLGVVAENLDYISSYDPAGYNGIDNKTNNVAWMQNKVGKLWFNTQNTRFVNYHQDDNEYNSKYWGTVFPGSDVAVYSWVESLVAPAFYEGPGTPFDIAKFSVSLLTDNNGNLFPKYYFWVRNTGLVNSYQNKTLSDTIIEQYISDPKNSGVAFMGPLSPNVYALYNSQTYINGEDTSVHIGYSQTDHDAAGHQEFQLIRADYADDFLPGFPNPAKGFFQPVGLYDRLIDSLSGTDETGAIVPDPYLPELVRTGISVRPRQSMFLNRFEALRNYLQYANEVVSKYPVNEFGNTTFLTASGEFFDTTKYWKNIYWWAEGFSTKTRTVFDVPVYSDLLRLTPSEGMIVGVTSNAQGNREVFQYLTGEWNRIGLENGTIEFLSTLWDYESNEIGYGENFYDYEVYDFYPALETRYVVRALNEQIYVGELLIHRNKSLILLFNYIQSENIEAQNYLPWLTKTSFTDVNYTVRELTENQKFQRDNETFLNGYINEVKPYHVVLKDFYLKYSRLETYQGNITDFDLPAKYDSEIGKFVTPQLTYTPGNAGPYLWSNNSSIWQDTSYSEWFNNFGLSIQDLPAQEVAKVAVYVTVNDQTINLENAKGLPVTGTVQLGEELIGYSDVDYANNVLLGISRGVNNTNVTYHFAGTPVIMTIPGVTVTYTGKNYPEAPEVHAYVNTTLYPAPTRPAVLRAIMAVDKVVGVEVVDSGAGYVVQPEIVIDPSFEVASVGLDSFNYSLNVVIADTTNLVTGDLVYLTGLTTDGVKVVEDGFYYVHIVNLNEIALFTTYQDSLMNIHRVEFSNQGVVAPTYVQKIDVRAKATASMYNDLVRSINTTLRFDRTTYDSVVKPWTAGQYYSSPYNSIGNDASGVVQLAETQIQYASPAYTATGSNTSADITVSNITTGGYFVNINDGGSGYSANDTLTVLGTALGGTTPDNDCLITVDAVNGSGAILTVTVAGNSVDAILSSLQGATMPIVAVQNDGGYAQVTIDYTSSSLRPGQINNAALYFYRELTPYVYDDTLAGGAKIRISRPRFNPADINTLYAMHIIVAGSIYSTGDIIKIPGSLLGGVDIINDATILIESVNVGEIVSASIEGIGVGVFDRFYAKPVTGTEINVYYDATLNIRVPYSLFTWTNSATDYAYLPEPIVGNALYNYTQSSLVSYAGLIWQCIDSNNDAEFNPTKWAPLNSADVVVNALDRIEAYYQPTLEMPGKNMQSLLRGITYPNTVYYGNKFAPEDALTLDVELRDQPFYPSDINVKAVVFDGTKLVAACDTSSASVVLTRTNTGTWSATTIADIALGVSDMLFANGKYFITTTNPAMPVLVSDNLTTWSTLGDITVPEVALSAIANNATEYVAAGAKIIESQDSTSWTVGYDLASRLPNNYNDIVYASITNFEGYIAVGGGLAVVANANTANPTISNVARIVTKGSSDGDQWTPLTPAISTETLNGVTVGNDLLVVVGNTGTIWYSVNGSNWVAGNISGSPVTANIKSVAYGNNIFVAAGEKIGAGSSDPAVVLTSTDGASWSQISSSSISVENLNNVTFADGKFYIAGENDTILESINGTAWTNIANVQVEDTSYVVQGNEFLFGYGPEELVGGVVTDTLSMFVRTAPGAYWDLDSSVAYWYKFTGFNMKQVYAVPDAANKVSFKNVVVNPARISVFVLDTATQLSYRIYEDTATNSPISYTVDWFNQTVEITGGVLSATEQIMIEVYEVGNGKELFRANSQLYPLQVEPLSGNSMFLIDIQYQNPINYPLAYANGVKLVYGVDFTIEPTVDSLTRIQFTSLYDTETDYVVFSLLDDTRTSSSTTQYGYSIPETTTYSFAGTTVTLDTELVTLTDDNEANAIVEVNGRRLMPSEYAFSGSDLVLDSAVTTDDLVAVTTYYDTSRQYLVTDTTTTKTKTVDFVDTSRSVVTIVFSADPSLVNSDKVILGGYVGNEALNGNVYYVKSYTPAVPDSNFYFELYLDATLVTPVYNTIGTVSGVGYMTTYSDIINVTYPTVPFGKDPLTYTDASRTWITVDGDRVNPAQAMYIEDKALITTITANGTTMTVKFLSQDTAPYTIGQAITISGSNIAGVDGSYTVATCSVSDLTVANSLTFAETLAKDGVVSSGSVNKLMVLADIASTSDVVVTAMIDGASPNPMTFNVNVNKFGDGSVYRTNLYDGSWLTQEFFVDETVMHFYNVSNLVDTSTTTVASETVDGNVIAFVQCVLTEVVNLRVVSSSGVVLDSSTYSFGLVDGKPAITFLSGVTAGQSVQVTLSVGNIVEIDGERIKFTDIDFVNNTISGLTRGVQGTRAKDVHTQYSIGYGINSRRKVADEAYFTTWNSDNIEQTGDPLQISTTDVAVFLQSNEPV